MLLLVDLGSIFVPTSLLDDELHGFNPLSHPGVKLYLYRINMEMDVLTETDQLRQWLVQSFLQMRFRHLKSDTTVGSSGLHTIREKSQNIFRRVFIVIGDTWATHYRFFASIEL
jgi:hypothetical protein